MGAGPPWISGAQPPVGRRPPPCFGIPGVQNNFGSCRKSANRPTLRAEPLGMSEGTHTSEGVPHLSGKREVATPSDQDSPRLWGGTPRKSRPRVGREDMSPRAPGLRPSPDSPQHEEVRPPLHSSVLVRHSEPPPFPHRTSTVPQGEVARVPTWLWLACVGEGTPGPANPTRLACCYLGKPLGPRAPGNEAINAA